MSKLPKNWEYGKLSQAAHVVRGITFPAGEKRNDLAHGYVCCLRTTNVQKKLEWDDVYYVPTSYVKRDEQLVREGDVLMSMANSYELVGKVARAINVPQPAAFGAFLAAVRPTHAIDGGYLYHFLRSSEVQSKLREGSSQTTNIANISAGKLSELTVPLAPWNEQKRIADKLDSVLARVDAVNTRLTRVASILKRFRQSVLAAATSGRLTEDWRVLNSTSKPWRKATLGDLIEEMRNGLAAKPDENPEGRKILRISAVRPGFLDTNDHRYLKTDESSAKLYELRKGDLLFTRYNGSLDYVGVCAMVSEDLPGYVYPDKLIRVRTKAGVALPKFIELASSAAEARQQIEGYVKSSAGQKGISGGNLKTLRIAVPPVEEQTEIVRRVETLFAFADRLEARLQTAQTATERLTPALLAKAFHGELVPQDPNDEPASELLRRLQQEGPSTSAKRGRKSAA